MIDTKVFERISERVLFDTKQADLSHYTDTVYGSFRQQELEAAVKEYFASSAPVPDARSLD